MLITNQISVIVIVFSIYLILLQHKNITLCLIFIIWFIRMCPGVCQASHRSDEIPFLFTAWNNYLQRLIEKNKNYDL